LVLYRATIEATEQWCTIHLPTARAASIQLIPAQLDVLYGAVRAIYPPAAPTVVSPDREGELYRTAAAAIHLLVQLPQQEVVAECFVLGLADNLRQKHFSDKVETVL